MERKKPMQRAAAKARGAAKFGIGRVPRMIGESARAALGLGHWRGGDVHMDLREAADADRAAAWLGHGGVLLRQGDTTILVDPVLSERIGPRVAGRVIGPARLSPTPVLVGGLPRVDLILITHAHFDHLDRPTLEQLASERTTVITSRRTRKLIPRGFGSVVELHWDGQLEVGGVRVTALRPEHWGGRSAVDVARGCNSYLIESNGWRVLAPGDTAETGEYAQVGRVDLATFGIGAYEPSEHHHATPEQVWGMFNSMPGELLLPIHHSTFELSAEHPDEPMERLIVAAGDEGHRIVSVEPGELWVP